MAFKASSRVVALGEKSPTTMVPRWEPMGVPAAAAEEPTAKNTARKTGMTASQTKGAASVPTTGTRVKSSMPLATSAPARNPIAHPAAVPASPPNTPPAITPGKFSTSARFRYLPQAS